jgi:DNA-binding transcriptional LysR family regulator
VRSLDLNLLVALDALLEEGSVSRAAKRMHVSPPAMSRTLNRIRDAVGDPILVRAGRELVPTARAAALRERVRALVLEAHALLDSDRLDLASLHRTFVIRCGDAVAGILGAEVVPTLRTAAPGVTVRFAPEGDEDVAPLRDGRIDIDIGVVSDLGPEIHLQAVCKGRVLGVVRKGHALASGGITARRFVEHAHVVFSRKGMARGPIDAALDQQGLAREVAAIVPSFHVLLQMVAASDLVGMMPSWLVGRATEALSLVTFPLPVPTPPLVLSLAWHPRCDADPAHRWLRGYMRDTWAERSLAPRRVAG